MDMVNKSNIAHSIRNKNGGGSKAIPLQAYKITGS
jgi:hypothetical protein